MKPNSPTRECPCPRGAAILRLLHLPPDCMIIQGGGERGCLFRAGGAAFAESGYLEDGQKAPLDALGLSGLRGRGSHPQQGKALTCVLSHRFPGPHLRIGLFAALMFTPTQPLASVHSPLCCCPKAAGPLCPSPPSLKAAKEFYSARKSMECRQASLDPPRPVGQPFSPVSEQDPLHPSPSCQSAHAFPQLLLSWAANHNAASGHSLLQGSFSRRSSLGRKPPENGSNSVPDKNMPYQNPEEVTTDGGLGTSDVSETLGAKGAGNAFQTVRRSAIRASLNYDPSKDTSNEETQTKARPMGTNGGTACDTALLVGVA